MVFLKFNSIQSFDIIWEICFVKSLDGISFLTNAKILPPFRFLSSLISFENPFIRNLNDGKVSSSFFSVWIRISTLFIMRRFSWSNLPGRGFIFKWPAMRLFALLILNLLSSHLTSSFYSISDWVLLFLDKYPSRSLSLKPKTAITNHL